MSGKLDMVNSNRFRLACEQGVTFSRRFTFKDADGALIDLSGYTGARMEVRAGTGGPTYSRGNWNPRSDSVDAWYSAIGIPAADGQAIVEWADSSDQSNNATGTGELDLIGDYPAVKFGAAQSMSAPFEITGPFTLAVVRKINATASPVLTVKAATRQLRMVLNADGTTREWGMMGRTMRTKWDAPTTEAGLNIDILSFTSDYETLARTNGIGYTPNVLSLADTASTNATVIGPNAHFSEVMFWDRALTQGEMETIEGYAARKYGLTLPTTHPFYTKTPTGLVEDAPIMTVSSDTGEMDFDLPESSVTVTIEPDVTKYLTPGMYYYDIILIGGSDRTRVLEGRFEITPRTTLG